MSKLLLLLFVVAIAILPLHSFAWDFFEFGNETEVYNSGKSNFQFRIGANLMSYEPQYNFDATKKDLMNREVNALGTEFDFGWEQKLFSGLSITPVIGAFFQRYTKDDVTKASPDLPEVVSTFDEKVEVMGGLAGGFLNYNFSSPLLGVTVQPFVAAFVGRGRSNMKMQYSYDLTPTTENYNMTIKEDFNFTRIGLGVNFLSVTKPYYGFIAFYQMDIDPQTRSEFGTFKESSGSTQAVDRERTDLKSYSSYIATVGMGYRF